MAAPAPAPAPAGRGLIDEVVQSSADATDEWLRVKARVRAHVQRVMAGDAGNFRQIVETKLRDCASRRKTVLTMEHTLSDQTITGLDPKGVLFGEVPSEIMPSSKELWEDAPEWMRPFLPSMQAVQSRTAATQVQGKRVEYGRILFAFTWSDRLKAEMGRRAEEFRAGAKRKAEDGGEPEREVKVKPEPPAS